MAAPAPTPPTTARSPSPSGDAATRFVAKWTPKIEEWAAQARTLEAQETPEDRAKRAREERRAAMLVTDEALRRSGLPPRCMAFTLELFPDRANPALADLGNFLDRWDGRRGLILTGGYGVGKTGLMAAALRTLVTRHADLREASLRFALAADVFDLLRDGYETHDAERRLARVRGARLLALDDLGAERPTPWVQERLLVIVNHRYEQQLPTWATTNYGLNQLAERVGKRTVWRLVETCDVIEVAGENLRARGAP